MDGQQVMIPMSEYLELTKYKESVDGIIAEISKMIEYGDSVAKTENNVATQRAYKYALEIVNKHIKGDK